MSSLINVVTLEQWIDDRKPLAIIDVREHGEYGAGHLFLATSLPYSQLELSIGNLVPQLNARVVVYDNGSGDVAQRSQSRLNSLGYTDVSVLRGGTVAWEAAGYSLFEGVNVPSKAFGEQTETLRKTPHISARQLATWQEQQRPLVILDGRPFSEFQKMSIPNGVCCPNGELSLRIDQLLPDDTTPVVINCAGRTRSIIGAQTLLDIGIKNPVYALENGTQGWMLNDLPLASKQSSRYNDSYIVDDERVSAVTRFALQHGVEWVTAEQFTEWQADGQVVYLLDVRTEDEFIHQTLPGAFHAAGGQLQQATDQYIAVRNASVVLFDDDGIRAPVTAAWLRQLGHRTFVLKGGLNAGLRDNVTGTKNVFNPPEIVRVTLADIEESQSEGRPVLLWDIRSSEQWSAGHLKGSRWVPRPLIAEFAKTLPENARVVFIGHFREQAAWASLDLPENLRLAAGVLDVSEVSDTFVTGDTLHDEQRIDFLFFTHDRHQGNKSSARQYLSWEKGLWARLTPQEKAIFNFPDGSV